MKKIFLLTGILFSVLLNAQTFDTTATADTVISIDHVIVSNSGFQYFDTLDFNSSLDSIKWFYSDSKDSIIVDSIFKIQFRINEQGTIERRIIIETVDTIVSIEHSFSSMMNIKDKNDKYKIKLKEKDKEK